MLRYETLMLVRPDVTSEELSTLEKNVEEIISSKQGKSLAYDKWGKYRLAYPVQKNNYGVYILARYEAEEAQVGPLLDALHSFFKIKAHDVVMRNVVKRLPEGASLMYQKPQALDAAGDLDPSLAQMASKLEEPAAQKQAEIAKQEPTQETETGEA